MPLPGTYFFCYFTAGRSNNNQLYSSKNIDSNSKKKLKVKQEKQNTHKRYQQSSTIQLNATENQL